MAVKLVAGLLKDYDRDPLPRVLSTRVTGLYTGVLPVLGDEGQEATYPLGESIRLLGVHLRLWGHDIGVQCRGWWFLSTSTKAPDSAVEVLEQWEPIIPCRSGIKPYFGWDGDSAEFSWTMDRLYTGAGRRFGLWVQNRAATRWWAMATFKIREG